jgi:hypothetical protein
MRAATINDGITGRLRCRINIPIITKPTPTRYLVDLLQVVIIMALSY